MKDRTNAQPQFVHASPAVNRGGGASSVPSVAMTLATAAEGSSSASAACAARPPFAVAALAARTAPWSVRGRGAGWQASAVGVTVSMGFAAPQR